MKTTVSSKYQIVIPKVVRKQLGIVPGQQFQIEAGANGSVVLKKESVTDMGAWLERYAGTLKTSRTAWGKEGLDATEWLRRQRDEDRR